MWEGQVEEKVRLPMNLTKHEQMYCASKQYIQHYCAIPNMPIFDPVEIIGPKFDSDSP